MSIANQAAIEHHGDALLTGDVLAHLNNQLDSARRMLAIVLDQAVAIRERAVSRVVQLASDLQTEMHRREVIEFDRHTLLERAGTKLSVAPEDVSMTMLAELMDPDSAAVARMRQAELRGLLGDIQREHHTNQALMHQELAFLEHLLRLAGSAGGYDAGGEPSSSSKATRLTRRPVFELEA